MNKQELIEEIKKIDESLILSKEIHEDNPMLYEFKKKQIMILRDSYQKSLEEMS